MGRVDFLEAPLATERLLLRPVRPDDARPIFALFNNWNIGRWLAIKAWPPTIERAEQHIARAIAEGAAHENYHVIALAGSLIGGIGWRWRPEGDGQRAAGPNIGYWLGEPFWGKGYMSEAAAALCEAIFAATDEPVIHSGLFDGNVASLRVQEKLGFTIVERNMQTSHVLGRQMPHINTELSRAALARRR